MRRLHHFRIALLVALCLLRQVALLSAPEGAAFARPLRSWSLAPAPTREVHLRVRGVGIERLCILASTADFSTQLPEELVDGSWEADAWEFIADRVGQIHFHPSSEPWESEYTRVPGHGDEELCCVIPRDELSKWPTSASFPSEIEFWGAVGRLEAKGLVELNPTIPVDSR